MGAPQEGLCRGGGLGQRRWGRAENKTEGLTQRRGESGGLAMLRLTEGLVLLFPCG